ncbi:hypothetical protein [Cytobacillus kochii]|uniref:hypothetical protein n=1 Tax=Cytobacillus kochii TaxID=859143 RepID=UPI0015D59422|nr:hypothetical protein [Cytobacillus kochii]
MDDILDRLKDNLENNADREEVLIRRYDLIKLIHEYEIETGRKKNWKDERW